MSDTSNRDIGRKWSHHRMRRFCSCWVCMPDKKKRRILWKRVFTQEFIRDVLAAIRSRGISRRVTVDEAGDTVWPNSDFLYEPPSSFRKAGSLPGKSVTRCAGIAERQG